MGFRETERTAPRCTAANRLTRANRSAGRRVINSPRDSWIFNWDPVPKGGVASGVGGGDELEVVEIQDHPTPARPESNPPRRNGWRGGR